MKYSLTVFDNIFDNRTNKCIQHDSWSEFEEMLIDLAGKPGYKPKKGERKKGSSLISPATYKKGTTRANDNVVSWGKWAAIDVDDYEGSPDEAVKIFQDYYYICYSSASSRKEHPKFRIVLPLSEEVMADKIRHFWYALNTEFKAVGDKQCKDLSRMYYVPAQYPNAFNFLFKNKDRPHLNPKTLMEKHDFVSGFKNSFGSQFPDKILEELKKYKKNGLNNYDFKWSSFHDCPFVNKRSVNEYRTLTGTGWYSKMYSIATAIACNAIKKGYPITPDQIEDLLRGIDNETGQWYKNRPLKLEAARAINYALENQI